MFKMHYFSDKFSKIYHNLRFWQYRSKGRARGGTRPGAQALGAHQHTFSAI